MTKTAHCLDAWMERALYSPKGPYFPHQPADLKPIGLYSSHLRDDAPRPLFRSSFPNDETIRLADRASEGIFDLLGSGPVDLKKYGDQMWHVDFKSGTSWPPHVFFTGVSHLTLIPGADIKVPWELSRCQHFAWLAQAQWLSQNDRYARVFVDQVNSWIESNPPKYGVNWRSSMEVALRACNWLLAWDIFQDNKIIDAEFRKRFSASLWEHGNHIYRHLEWGGNVSTNHYLSNLLGLAYLGVALDQKKWKICAQNELARELFRQTYDDGFDYEGSTAYHRLVLEIFFYYSLLVKRNPMALEPLGAVFLERLGLMFEAMLQLTAPDGTMPLLGDNDSGHVHCLVKREDADVSYLTALGAALLDQTPLKVKDWEAPAEIFWLFGESGLKNMRAVKTVAAKQIRSKGPSSSGLLTIRDQNSLLVFSAAPNGTRGVGGHTHNDKLSFCLWIQGEWFLWDPGTGVYSADPDLRNRLRSTASHNTVQINDEEQNRILPASLFSLKDDAKTSVLAWDPECVEVSHDGYKRLQPPVIHQRRIEHRQGSFLWKVEDVLNGEGEVEARWFFHSSHLDIQPIEPFKYYLNGKHGRLEIQCNAISTPGEIKQVPMSPGYGVIQRAWALAFRQRVTLPFKCNFVMTYVPQ
ncbi:MAG: hypothetical protein KCHDKBKB_00466 [Elusimicrobia bacterium]|nr:hypothetical protein [Elusimicrobiota bacterium]